MQHLLRPITTPLPSCNLERNETFAGRNLDRAEECVSNAGIIPRARSREDAGLNFPAPSSNLPRIEALSRCTRGPTFLSVFSSFRPFDNVSPGSMTVRDKRWPRVILRRSSNPPPVTLASSSSFPLLYVIASLPFLFLMVQVVILLDIRFFELFLPRRRVKIFIFSCSWGRVDDWFRNWIRGTVLLVLIISKNKFGNGKKGKYYEGLIYQAWKMLWAYRGCMINLMGKLKCAFTVVSPKFTRPVSPNEFYIRSPKWPIRSHRSSRRNDISITVLFVYFIHPRASPLIYI